MGFWTAICPRTKASGGSNGRDLLQNSTNLIPVVLRYVGNPVDPGEDAYRGSSLIRNSRPPQDHHRTLGTLLL